MIQSSFRDQGIAKLDRLKQDLGQKACSSATAPSEAVAKQIEADALATIRWPQGGNYIGDWRQGERLGLLYMDLDGFKSVNDTYGHQAGDTVLQEVGRRLQNAVRTSDTVARLAGDEFAVLLAHLSVEDDLERVMGEIENAVARPVMWQGQELRVGVSIGSAVFPDQADVAESLIGAADQAMYLAKQQHRQAAGPGGAPFPSLQSLHST